MGRLLYQYEMNPTTWVYLSSLMTIAIYFKFSRLWSVRNLDLLALISFAPGLLAVKHGGTAEQVGYMWLFCVGTFFLVRLLLDSTMVRRPLLEPNMNPGGLLFTGTALLVFLFTNVITSQVTSSDLEGARRLDQLLGQAPVEETDLTEYGPGYPLLHLLGSMPTRAIIDSEDLSTDAQTEVMLHTATTRTMAILSHLAIVIGIVLIGHWHFKNVKTGVAAATLYLLLPYTSQMVGRVDHVLPAALLVWAVLAYRRPMIAGILLGVATGAIYYPLFLLPLWIGFYWPRGLWRFLAGFVLTILVLTASLALTSATMGDFWAQTRQMFGWTTLLSESTSGFWAYHEVYYRLPVLAALIALSAGLALWPAQKNLGTLLSCSAAVMLGTQFWHANEGGLYMAWYLPLLLLTVFRPNLEDRVAPAMLLDGWFTARRLEPIERAA